MTKEKIIKAPVMKVAKPKKVKEIKLPVPLEKVVHLHIAEHLILKYPELIFHSDFAAAARMTVGQIKANRAIQSGKFWPDLFISFPKIIDKEILYCGLYIEVKRSWEEIYRKDGTLKESWVNVYKGRMLIGKYDHLAGQSAMLERLNKLGYKATFGCGIDDCISIIEKYMGND